MTKVYSGIPPTPQENCQRVQVRDFLNTEIYYMWRLYPTRITTSFTFACLRTSRQRHHLLLPANEGNVFTGVSLSFCWGGGPHVTNPCCIGTYLHPRPYIQQMGPNHPPPHIQDMGPTPPHARHGAYPHRY